MKISFVGYKRQYQNQKEELDAVWHEIMSGGDFILRQHLKSFESNLAKFLNARHAVGVNSGTDAQFLLLKALGVGPGDEVITVAHTFLSTVGGILNVSARPILVDVDENGLMNLDQVEKAINNRTRVILPVHLNGLVCDMGRVKEIADEHAIDIVEDACQALGGSFNGTKVGSLEHGFFSFYPAKILGSCGDGGAVTTRDPSVARRIKELRDNGRTATGGVNGFGFCSRMDNLQAAILDARLKHFPTWVQRRQEIAKKYSVLLDHTPVFNPPIRKQPYEDVFQNYVIQTPDRDKLQTFLKGCGTETMVHWRTPMHKEPSLGLSGYLPETERLSREVLSLPMYPELTDGEINTITFQINNFFEDDHHEY